MCVEMEADMTLEDAVDKLEVDFERTMARMCNNEQLYKKLLRKMLSDKNFITLKQAVEENDYSTIEIAAHTLKGVAGNLGLNKLQDSCNVMITSVRSKEYDKVPQLQDEIEKIYNEVCEVIGQIDSD